MQRYSELKLATCQVLTAFFCLFLANAQAALDAPHNASTATGCLSPTGGTCASVSCHTGGVPRV